MRKYFFIACLASLFSAHNSHAAPAPWGLAINTETKECAGYWGGDEFVDYKLPDGWKAYYPTSDPEHNLWSIIKTDAGDCSFQIQKEEACCMELGYTFVSDNIGKGQKTILRDREAFKKQLEQHRKYGKYSYLMPLIFFGALAIAILAGIVGVILLLVFLIRYLWKKTRPRNS